MSDKSKRGNENTDNMAQNDEMDETLANNAEGNDPQELNEDNGGEAAKLRGELAELNDKYLRMVAEFDNFRRRNAKERLELVQTAGKDVLQSLLVVLDDMDRAGKQLENTTDLTVLKEGISLVFNKFRNIMQQKGLKAMESNGEFNPDLHEAITEIPAPNEKMIGKIIDTIEPGYYLNDKLIRHAKVIVGK